MAITDKVAIENYTLTTIDNSMDTQLTEWISGVEKFINMQTDRQIIADSVDATWKYDGNDKTTLLIDDFVAITSISVDGSAITADCYQYPANKTPKWKLETTLVFTKGRQNVSIVGKRGYATQANLPLDLKWAATVLVAGIMNYANPAKGEVASESIGRYSVSYVTDSQNTDYKKALDIIKSYRRIR